MNNREILEGLTTYDAEITELRKAIKDEQNFVNSLSLRLTEVIELRYRQQIRILKAISELDDPIYRTLLIGTYFNKKTRVRLRREINYSLAETYKKLRKAEQRLNL